MTREEASYEIERLLRHWDDLENDKRRFWGYDQEAVEIALTALRLVSRGQVEKVFPGCPYCKEDPDGYVQKFGAYSIQGGELTTGHCKPQKINFCPHCSRPLTDEAVEIRLKELEALKDD